MLLEPAEVVDDRLTRGDAPLAPRQPLASLCEQLVEQRRALPGREAVRVAENAQPLAPTIERQTPLERSGVDPQRRPVRRGERNVEGSCRRGGELPVDQRDGRAVAEDDVRPEEVE